jgi:NAD(P)H-dependent FMN reductase
VNVLAFAASSSRKSINKKLVTYAVGFLEDVQAEVLDLNDYELPLFSEDKEAELGKPQLAQDFFAKIGECDALIISFAEHNGSYSAAYKSLFDWCSRIDPKVFQQKPMVYLSTSPGPGGAQTVLASAIASSGHFGGELKASLSIPSFYENFDIESGTLKNKDLDDSLRKTVAAILL